MRPTDLFLHIPKTGGSSLRSALRLVYGWGDAVHTTGKNALTPEQVIAEVPNLSSLRLLRGHFGFGIHEYASRPCRYFTMMREPVARVVSLYYYIKRAWPDTRAASMGLRRYVVEGHSTYVPNDQVRRLAGPPFEPFASRATLERAKENLASQNVLLGLTERFDESLVLFRRGLGWSWPPFYLRSNTGGSAKPSPRDLPADLRGILHEQNAQDVALYQYARRRFEAHLTAEGTSFERELWLFQKTNALLGAVLAPFYPLLQKTLAATH